MKHTLLLLLSIVALTESEIIKDSTELSCDSGVNFLTNSLVSYECNKASCFGPLKCTTSVTSDLFFRTIDIGTCTWYCRTYQFGMFKTFYRSKDHISKYNLDNLNLNDTAQFYKIVGAQCTLPYYKLSSGSSTGSFFVGTIQNNKYVLFTIFPKMLQGYKDGPPPIPYYYYKDVIVKWWIQTDGTTSFSGVTKTLPRVSGVSVKMKAAGTVGTYNIFGQRVSSKRNGSQILIQNKRLVFKNGR